MIQAHSHDEDHMPPFSPDNFTPDALADSKDLNRLGHQYLRLEKKGLDISQIQAAVEGALRNVLEGGARSFVIYGEPQSGKTEMMTALTAGLLDGGMKTIIVLTNDSVQLLSQNLRRFAQSGLTPAPRSFHDILDPKIKLKDREWVIFAKKNSNDLTKLLDRVKKLPSRVIIDDEADYATPNSRVNNDKKTAINSLVEQLIGEDGYYIGVTATPARLDLNLTFKNDNASWVDFPAHAKYTGQETFFPTSNKRLLDLDYTLTLLPDQQDSPKYLRTALLSFIVNAAYLNMADVRPGSYSMLIHTSGKKVDHGTDYNLVSETFSALSDHSSRRYLRLVKEAYEIASKKYSERIATSIVQYALNNISKYNIVLMNSDDKQKDYERATDPTAMFTVAIGGNIVSRGVTFNNLLLMFFTRDARHQIQQDTYIQRARMFGARGDYLKWFELHIPKSLYFDWQRCFVFHKLSLQRLRDGLGAPTWIQDNRIKPAAAASISRAGVDWVSGEMYWDQFALTEEVRTLTSDSSIGLEALTKLRDTIGSDRLPDHLIEFIENFQPHGDDSVVIHAVTELTTRYGSANIDDITREKGLMGANQLERTRFPRAIHHIKLFANPDGMARVYYKYAPSADDIRVQSKNLTFLGRVESSFSAEYPAANSVASR